MAGEGTPAPRSGEQAISQLPKAGDELGRFQIVGEHPFPEAPPGTPLFEVIRSMVEQRWKAPSLRAACPQVPWSLYAIVSKCLDPEPDRRYARARDLAEDLRRFGEDLPLKYTIEPSVRERVAKFVRRHLRLCGSTSITLSSVVLVLLLGILLGWLANHNKNVDARLKYWLFQTKFNECQFFLNTSSGPTDHFVRGIALAEKTLNLQGIGKSGEWRGDFWVHRLTPPEQAKEGEQTVELILLEARARTDLANRRGSEADQRTAFEWAVTWRDRSERLDLHPPATL
jgi:eukaryotic-like serine/threonine-protein kinase